MVRVEQPTREELLRRRARVIASAHADLDDCLKNGDRVMYLDRYHGNIESVNFLLRDTEDGE